jgi:hypothetical protein
VFKVLSTRNNAKCRRRSIGTTNRSCANTDSIMSRCSAFAMLGRPFPRAHRSNIAGGCTPKPFGRSRLPSKMPHDPELVWTNCAMKELTTSTGIITPSSNQSPSSSEPSPPPPRSVRVGSTARVGAVGGDRSVMTGPSCGPTSPQPDATTTTCGSSSPAARAPSFGCVGDSGVGCSGADLGTLSDGV